MKILFYTGPSANILTFIDNDPEEVPYFLFTSSQEKLREYLFLKGYINKDIQIRSKKEIEDIIEIITLLNGPILNFEVYKNRKSTFLSQSEFIDQFG